MNREPIETCEVSVIHEDVLARVKAKMPDEEPVYEVSELFKVFGDSTRVKILYALLESELCVCDIAKLMEVSQSAVSHQLRALKNVRLVKSRREGKTVFYSLADRHIRTIINQGMEHIQE